MAQKKEEKTLVGVVGKIRRMATDLQPTFWNLRSTSSSSTSEVPSLPFFPSSASYSRACPMAAMASGELKGKKQKKRVAVVGSGISGLTAALLLQVNVTISCVLDGWTYVYTHKCASCRYASWLVCIFSSLSSSFSSSTFHAILLSLLN